MFADDAAFLRLAGPHDISHDHQPRGNAHAGLEGLRAPDMPSDCINQSETCSDCVFGIILLCSWVTEIGQDPVAHVLGDVALVAFDHFGYAAMICSDDLAEVLWIKAR